MATFTSFQKALAAASATAIATSQAATAGTPLTINGSAATGGVATLDTQRRVLMTSTSGAEAAVITITGTNQNGAVISETITFPAATTIASNLDYVTVTRIVPSGTITGSLSAGTNTTGSSPWWTTSLATDPPMNISAGIQLLSGAATYSVEYTYDDPNNLPSGTTFPFPWTNSTPAALVGSSATKDGLFNFPVLALRLTITAGTGTLKASFVQAGIG